MTDTLTTEELVTLAEFCGHRTDGCDGSIWIDRNPPQGFDELWQPHLDAKQRDEVVEALSQQERWRCIGVYRQNDWAMCEVFETDVRVAKAEANTPGLAVCRAALKAIAGASDEGNNS